MRRFQLSHDQSLDGVLDQLNSKHMSDAGPLQLLDAQSHYTELQSGQTGAGVMRWSLRGC